MNRRNRTVLLSLCLIAFTFTVFRQQAQTSHIAQQSCQCTSDVNAAESTLNNTTSQQHDVSASVLPPAYTSRNKIVIYTSSRTGSSFTGEFFQQNSAIHYLFEPLKLLSLADANYVERHYMQGQIAQYLLDAFNCDYRKLFRDSYTISPNDNSVRRDWTRRVFAQTAKRHGSRNMSREFLEETCRRYDTQVLKIIRSDHVHSVLPLILDHDVRVLYLLRDPRAKAISRLEIDAQKAKQSLYEFLSAQTQERRLLDVAKTECEHLQDTVSFMSHITSSVHQQKFSRLFRIVRYEDIAAKPVDMAKKIYAFMNLTYTPEVDDWIRKSTTDNRGNLFSTSRDSKAAIEKWRTKLSYELIAQMQSSCQSVLHTFGYKSFASRTELLNFNSALVLSPSNTLSYRLH